MCSLNGSLGFIALCFLHQGAVYRKHIASCVPITPCMEYVKYVPTLAPETTPMSCSLVANVPPQKRTAPLTTKHIIVETITTNTTQTPLRNFRSLIRKHLRALNGILELCSLPLIQDLPVHFASEWSANIINQLVRGDQGVGPHLPSFHGVSGWHGVLGRPMKSSTKKGDSPRPTKPWAVGRSKEQNTPPLAWLQPALWPYGST